MLIVINEAAVVYLSSNVMRECLSGWLSVGACASFLQVALGSRIHVHFESCYLAPTRIAPESHSKRTQNNISASSLWACTHLQPHFLGTLGSASQLVRADIVAREFWDRRGKKCPLHGRWIIAWASRDILTGSKIGFAELYELDSWTNSESITNSEPRPKHAFEGNGDWLKRKDTE